MPDDECFVIGPIGESGSEIRRKADQVIRHIIEPAALSVGLKEVKRADHIDSAGVISSEIVSHLLDARFVVADLSGGNPNAYYELAVRHMFRKPFAHLISNSERIPFDLSQNRAIWFDLSDPDSVAEARKQLEQTMMTELAKPPEDIETPFSTALQTKELLRIAREDSASDLRDIARIIARLDAAMREVLVHVRSDYGHRTPPFREWANLDEEPPSPLTQLIRAHWDGIRDAARRRHFKAGALLNAAYPRSVVGGTLFVGLRFTNHVEMLEADDAMREAIERAVEEVIGESVTVVGVLWEQFNPNQ